MRLCAWIVFLAGLVGLVYALMMDTTVPVPGDADAYGLPHRVHNIGLLDERRTILIVSGLGVTIGVIVECFAISQRKRETPQPSAQRPGEIDPDNWQNQDVEIDRQRAEWGAIAGKKRS